MRWPWKRRPQPPPETIEPEQVLDDDPILRDVIARAWNSGKTVLANVDDDGIVQYADDEEESEETP